MRARCDAFRQTDRMDAAESLILMCVPGADRCARGGGGRNYGGLLGGGSLMKPSACGLRLAVVNDVWDNGVTDVTVGVIAQGVIMLHHASVRVPCDGTMLMPSGPYAPRPRLPSITVGSQALQSTLSIFSEFKRTSNRPHRSGAICRVRWSGDVSGARPRHVQTTD